MIKLFINIGSVALFVSVLISCSEEISTQKYRHVETIDLDHGLFNLHTIIEGDAHSGKKFSRADVGNNFGLGYSLALPDTLIGKSMAVNVSGWTRTGDLSNGCDLVLTVTSNDSILLWSGCMAKEVMKNPNEWSFVSKEFVLPTEMTSKNNVYINVMAHNVEAKSFFDVDDIKVEYKEIDVETDKE
jgi:hypothetical protein